MVMVILPLIIYIHNFMSHPTTLLCRPLGTGHPAWLHKLPILRRRACEHHHKPFSSRIPMPVGTLITSEPECTQTNPPPSGDAMDVLDLSQSWKAFARSSDLPPLVKKLMLEVVSLESELGEKLVFGGPRGNLQGRAKAAEEHRHRAFYGHLPDGEEKLQFYSARQIACRILGSKGYLCENCWLPSFDCICKKVERLSLWPGIQFWLYMHPKDFLRKNNSGKLLWQTFGEHSARLCIFGIQEHEDIMWDALRKSGQGLVWYLYPEQSPTDYHVDDIKIPKELACQGVPTEVYNPILNFILIDGTWSNSKAMVNRLQDRAKQAWPDQPFMNSVSLSPEKLSVLHNLRPQPSLDRTCTAAAAAQLLRELDLRQGFQHYRLTEAADGLEYALEHLLDALTTRRERMGRAIIRYL